jgi:uncharacterized protein with GYD domain
MPTFITTGKFSAEGARGLLAKPEDRAIALRKLIEAGGGKLLHYYFTTGETDFLIIAEAPDGSDAVASSMAAAASGTASNIQTVRAWTSAEFVTVAEKAGRLAGAYTAPGKG